MSGVDVGESGGKKRATNSDINMIPFIDLLMCTIAFLLITAVWVTNSRLNANAQVPGSDTDKPVEVPPPSAMLHLHVMDNEFALIWKMGSTVISENRIPRVPVDVDAGNGNKVLRYPDLAKRIAEEWRQHRGHFDLDDKNVDQCTLHTENAAAFREIVGVMDALYGAKRDMRIGGAVKQVPAFNMTFAVR